MMLTAAILLTISAAASAALGTPDEAPSKISYCDLLSASRSYDQKVVATEALVGSSFHSVAVYDPKCMSTETESRSASVEFPAGWKSTQLGKKLSKVLRHGGVARVAFEATFHATGGPYGGDGTRFRLAMQRIVSVEEVSKNEINLGSSRTGGTGGPAFKQRVNP